MVNAPHGSTCVVLATTSTDAVAVGDCATLIMQINGVLFTKKTAALCSGPRQIMTAWTRSQARVAPSHIAHKYRGNSQVEPSDVGNKSKSMVTCIMLATATRAAKPTGRETIASSIRSGSALGFLVPEWRSATISWSDITSTKVVHASPQTHTWMSQNIGLPFCRVFSGTTQRHLQFLLRLRITASLRSIETERGMAWSWGL